MRSNMQSRQTASKESAGFPFVFCFIVLAIVGGLLGYNYLLNVEAEKQTQLNRPYGSFKTEDLIIMIEGYETELKNLEKHEAEMRTRHRGPQNHPELMENVQEFEKMTQQSLEKREVSLGIGKAQATLNDLRAEKKIRDAQGLAAGWSLHARRLFSFGQLLQKIQSSSSSSTTSSSPMSSRNSSSKPRSSLLTLASTSSAATSSSS